MKTVGSPIRSFVGYKKCSLSRVCRCKEFRVRSVSRGTTPVFDYFLLTQKESKVENEFVQMALEEVWGLQYKIPGVVAAFIGPVIKSTNLSFDSAVFFRFSNAEIFKSFIEKSSIRSKIQDDFKDLFQSHKGVLIQHQVANEMESIFRKGELFETGFEHILCCQLISKYSTEEAKEFLTALCQIAKTTEIGAIESSVGIIESETSSQLVMVNHFSDEQGIELLENTPPVQQLWNENGNGLIKAEYSFCMDITPPTNP